jgi:quercetin dioxygenase-like cupin family protein
MRLLHATVAAALACASCFSAVALADPPSDVMQIMRDADVNWTSGQFGSGVQTAVLAGNPSQPGPYVVRIKFPPGTMSPPHFHPETRYVLVLKGTWWVGSGPKWDRDATTPVSAGTLVVHHPDKIHFDGAKDEEVVLQIVGLGPSGTTPVDESGQPKK